jgi:hypothetical protein
MKKTGGAMTSPVRELEVERYSTIPGLMISRQRMGRAPR